MFEKSLVAALVLAAIFTVGVTTERQQREADRASQERFGGAYRSAHQEAGR